LAVLRRTDAAVLARPAVTDFIEREAKKEDPAELGRWVGRILHEDYFPES
jgi:hypothetical protein